MGCGTSAMFKEKKSEKFEDSQHYYSLRDAMKPAQNGGSVIDLTIKSSLKSPKTTKSLKSINIRPISDSSGISSDLSKTETELNLEEYDELPPRRTPSGGFFEDYDVPQSRHQVNDDYDVPRSNFQLSNYGSDEYDYPRSFHLQNDVSFLTKLKNPHKARLELPEK